MIKDILVHLTGSSEDAVRLHYANGLAQMLGAHLTGLQVHELPSILAITDPSGSAFLQELIETSNKEADGHGARLKEQLAAFGPHTELRRIDVYPETAGRTLADEARTSDLFVGTRPYGDPGKSERIEEAVLFRSGRACLFLPPMAQSRAKVDTVVVAWKNTREAARAVAAAIPVLQLASSVEVVMVSEGPGSLDIEDSADIGRYLSRHGIKATIRTVPGAPDTATALLREAHASAADLIVMGGYGHARLQELVLGGATRDILRNSDIPVLMAH
jgi:nucleotide-binding universal stress UspA family protein